jgi:hypothetical protein
MSCAATSIVRRAAEAAEYERWVAHLAIGAISARNRTRHHWRVESGRSVKRGDSSTGGPNPLGECSLRGKFNVYLAPEVHPLK